METENQASRVRNSHRKVDSTLTERLRSTDPGEGQAGRWGGQVGWGSGAERAAKRDNRSEWKRGPV